MGPPRYGATHPTWGFPPVARLQPAGDETATAAPGPAATRRSLSVAIVAALTAAVACAALGAAETWRFVLVLRGRTEVLDARPIAASDIAVAGTALTTLVATVAALAAVAYALATTHRAAAHRACIEPTRTAGAIAARVLVPGWNVIGAGPVLVETARLVSLAQARQAIPRTVRRRMMAAWGAWLVNGAAALAVFAATVPVWAGSAFARSDRYLGNLVEAHAAVAVIGAATAVLVAGALDALRGEWTGGRPPRRATWVVAEPASSATNLHAWRRGPATGEAQPSYLRTRR